MYYYCYYYYYYYYYYYSELFPFAFVPQSLFWQWNDDLCHVITTHTHWDSLCSHHTCYRLWILAPMYYSGDNQPCHWCIEGAGLSSPAQDIFPCHLHLWWQTQWQVAGATCCLQQWCKISETIGEILRINISLCHYSMISFKSRVYFINVCILLMQLVPWSVQVRKEGSSDKINATYIREILFSYWIQYLYIKSTHSVWNHWVLGAWPSSVFKIRIKRPHFKRRILLSP